MHSTATGVGAPAPSGLKASSDVWRRKTHRGHAGARLLVDDSPVLEQVPRPPCNGWMPGRLSMEGTGMTERKIERERGR